jgi:thiol:disulfide interchange protein DsbD
MRNLLILLIVTIVMAAGNPGQAAPKDLVLAELRANVASMKPGKPFTAGVLLTIKPGWHIYWKNPGDSGLPTRVTWKLPTGFTAGPLQFPIPVTFDQPGDIAGYGYHDQVLLMTEITPPADLLSAAPVEIAADVSWLVCEKVCIPGKATVKTSLPVSQDVAPANADLFATWSDRKSTTSDSPREAKAGPDGFTVEFPLPAGAQNVQWFPVPPEGSGVEEIQTTTTSNVSTTKLKLLPAPKTAAEMQFLVAYTGSNGKRQGVEFGVKLPPPAK